MVLVLGSNAAALVPDEPYRIGNFGVHTLIAEEPYEAARCNYDTLGVLTSIMVRQPIAFAFNRTGHVDQQFIGWRYEIEATDSADTYNGPYFNIATSTLKKVSTTEQHPAAFLDRTYHVAASTHMALRVVVKIYWYWPSSPRRSLWFPDSEVGREYQDRHLPRLPHLPHYQN